MFFYLEETLLGLELAILSYHWILQEESHTIDLQSIQINKYKTIKRHPCLVKKIAGGAAAATLYRFAVQPTWPTPPNH